MVRGKFFDTLIVGGGIAGQLLARALARRGERVCLACDPMRTGASEVAAWMVNPVTGIRFVPSWRVEEFLPEAISLYRELEAESGLKIWHPLTIYRLFQGDDERPRWEKKRANPVIGKYVTREFSGDSGLPGLKHERGGIVIEGGGWADLRPWLEYARKCPSDGVEIVEKRVEKSELLKSRMTLGDREFRRIIFCTGYGKDPLPWKPAKGELLTVCVPGLALTNILLRGIFMIPLGGSLYRVGATYEWEDLSEGASEKGVEYLKGKLGKLIQRPFEIVDALGAVRPILRDARPVLGLESGDGRIGIFNGLGSKAALMAPTLARQFAEHLVQGTPLDREVDLRRLPY